MLDLEEPVESSDIIISSHADFVERFAAVSAEEILDALVKIPIQTWNYKDDDPAIRHMGPMAQDFYAAFGLGNTDKVIFHIDAVSVCLASIQGLAARFKRQAAQIENNQATLDQLTSQISTLEQQLHLLQNENAK